MAIKVGILLAQPQSRSLGNNLWSLIVRNLLQKEHWSEWLKEAFFHVNKLLFEHASDNAELKGMGTTLDAALINGRSCLVTHVGDSRVYAINKEGVRQITRDHSYVNILLDSGEITEEEAAIHPQRNWIMKAVGSEKHIEPDLYSMELDDETFLLICTDGLSNKVDKGSIYDIVMSDTTLRQKAEILIDLANQMGGEDNISVIVLGPSNVEVNTP